MPTSPEVVKSWMDVAQPAIGVALVAVLSFVAAYFARKKDGLADTGAPSSIVNTSVGAAFMDKETGPALLRIDKNVQQLVDIARAREEQVHEDEIAERAASKAAKLAAAALRAEIEERERQKPAPARPR